MWDRVEVVDAESLVVMTNKLSGLVNTPYTPRATQMYTRLIKHALRGLKGHWEMQECRKAPSGTIIEIAVDDDMTESLDQQDFTIQVGLAGLVMFNMVGKKMAQNNNNNSNDNEDDKASTVGGDLTHTFEHVGLGGGAENEGAVEGDEVMEVADNPDDYLLESTDDEEDKGINPGSPSYAAVTTGTASTTATAPTTAARVAAAAAAATLAVAAAATAAKKT